MVYGLYPDLNSVAKSSEKMSIYITNGHGTWEAALTNTLSRGDRILTLATGRFVVFWSNMAERLGVNVDLMDFGKSASVDLNQVEEKLRADKDRNFKAILVTQTDTASSVRNDIASLSECIHSTGHPALLMVDCMASLACDPFEMDEWKVDCAISGSQKGFMLPSGMAIMCVSEKALAAHKSAELKRCY